MVGGLPAMTAPPWRWNLGLRSYLVTAVMARLKIEPARRS
jgi:hypothetical protein